MPPQVTQNPESAAGTAGEARVALVNMPFGDATRPSIQCGLLKASLARAGYDAKVFYLNLELAAKLGAPFYHELSRQRKSLLLGEWLFSVAAFGYKPDEEAYRDAHPAWKPICKTLKVDFDRFSELRNEILPAWIRQWAQDVDWSAYSAVGFTSTFEQNAAALAMAQAIKEEHSGIVTVFGGANFDGDMGKEYVRALPFIDYACIGEGDVAFPKIIDSIVQGESALDIAGVIGRSNGTLLVDKGPAPSVENLDDLPVPDYDEYFETLFRLGRGRVLGKKPPILLFETARGCWWGEKQHCTFCGLNNNGMKFRAKSPDRVPGHLRELAARYKIVNFEAVDNIMDYKYLESVCAPLADKHLDYRIFYEVKANLTMSQLRTMARAGITAIQPGIESLNSHILTLMRKGITMLRNVRLLKWAHYYKMRVAWSILTGFPGETEEDYAEQFRVVQLVRHLPPPHGAGPIWLERFSPYFFDESFPVKNVKPLDVYGFIYPEDQIDLKEIAYFFSYDMDSTLPATYHDELRHVLNDWGDAWKSNARPELVYQRAPDWVQVIDRRTDDLAAHSFQDLDAAVYEICSETDRTVKAVCGILAKTEGADVSPEEVHSSLKNFCELGLMLEEKGKFLSLALPVNRNYW